jgi:tetratricopeptide (TPR) repeat protein
MSRFAMKRLRRALSVLALGLAPLATPTRVRAEPASPVGTAAPKPGSKRAIAEARRHFQNALESYRNGAYKQAIDELEQALVLDPQGKDLVYNLALVYEKLGDVDRALEQFRRYVAMETDATEIERVNEIVRRLEGARKEVRGPELAPPVVASEAPGRSAPAPPAPVADDGSRGAGARKVDGWVIGAGGVAATAILAGTIFGIRALVLRPSSDETTDSDTGIEDLKDRAERAHGSAVLADVLFAVGIAAGGAAAGLYFLREPDTASAGTPRRARGAAVSFGARF